MGEQALREALELIVELERSDGRFNAPGFYAKLRKAVLALAESQQVDKLKLRNKLEAAIDRGVTAWQEAHCQEVECGCVSEYVKKEIRAMLASQGSPSVDAYAAGRAAACAPERVRREALEEAAQLADNLAQRCEYPEAHDACDFFGCFDIQRLAQDIRALAAWKERCRR